MDPKDYWRLVCAPVVRGKKEKLKKQKIGGDFTNSDIAAAVERATGKDTSRQLVEHWLNGRREPYLSQFIALCAWLEVDPIEALKPAGTTRVHFSQGEIPSLIYNSRRENSTNKDEKKKRRTRR